MFELKILEVCTLPEGCEKDFAHFYLKDSMVHWVHGTTYYRYNIDKEELLAPIELPISCCLVSADEEEIEVTDSHRVVYVLSLNPVKIVSTRRIEGPLDARRIFTGTMYLGYNTACEASVLKFISMSRKGRDIEIPCTGWYQFICPRWYQFIGLLSSKGTTLSLWWWNGRYYLLGPEGMIDTGARCEYLSTCRTHLLLKDRLISLTREGTYVNDKKIDSKCWSSLRVIAEDHIMDIRTYSIFRIKDLDDIKTKSCTKRT